MARKPKKEKSPRTKAARAASNRGGVGPAPNRNNRGAAQPRPGSAASTAAEREGSPRGTEPAPERRDGPIVVVGASAGGLDAFKRFLAAMPGGSGIALVLVPHLDPHHESLMVELLAKHTAMPVHEASHGTVIRPNHVYVIPPNKYLAIKERRLDLSPPPTARGLETAIDFALCSLAHDQQDAAIGIILSGTGNHGALGIKEIKLAGGLVLVQDPATAEFDQMPRSALATGYVDQVLRPEEMPAALVSYARQWHRPSAGEPQTSELAADVLRRVLALLQARTKHDFRHYRKNMIVRRIQRRMALLQSDDWAAYADYLRDNPNEITALHQDLLIGVTAFFRDPEAFDALAEHVLPKLVERASANAPIRVWVPGCASGEEAYSIAMLLIDEFRAADKPPNLQIFATDIDERALETARQGIYPDGVASVLSPERLKRFFTKIDQQHYQVSKPLRDSIVFAAQNLISDAPFSKLDLVSCRNVLIYLEPDVQEKVVSLLHFALNEDGYLFLGPSESIGRSPGMFEAVVKKWRLYKRIGPVRRDLISIPISADEQRPRVGLAEPARRVPPGFTQLMQRLLAEDFAPASALVNRDFEILSVQGPLANYLEFPAGEFTKDLLAMARQGLRIRIRSACEEAIRTGHTVTEPNAKVRRNGGYVPCSVTVRPISAPKDAEGLLLVVFQDQSAVVAARAEPTSVDLEESSVVRQLENELRATREDLQGTIEELESSNEELKASNEEIMSMNEELQSTNEELETSKEELQSLNEELSTVNSQIQDKVEELDAANGDLANLLAATDIATIFLDAELRIKRFNASIEQLVNLIATDIGRPFRDISPRFKDDDLLRDAEHVLAKLTPSERTVHDDKNHWYLRRILPYRTLDQRIGGVVITFVDITERMAIEAEARHLAAMLHDSKDALVISALDGSITGWNSAAAHAYAYSESQALKMNLRDIVPEKGKAHIGEIAARFARGEEVEGFEAQRVTLDGRLLDVWVTPTALRDDSGNVVAIARTERDITVRRQIETEVRKLNAELEQRVAQRTADLEKSEQRVRSVLDAAVDAIITIDEGGTIETFNAAAERMFGYPAREAIGQNVGMLMSPAYRDFHDDYIRRHREANDARVIGGVRELKARRKDGKDFPVQLTVGEIPALKLFTGIIRDITEQRAMQEDIIRMSALEQRRIGQELHDGTQQELTGLSLVAANLSEALEQAGSTESALAAKLAAGIAEANRRVRLLAKGLVPVAVDAEGLKGALADLAARTERDHGIACRLECPSPLEVSDDVVALHLYRIAQEAVTNAVKHSRATTIWIRLERKDAELALEVRDDGVGIDDARRMRSEGLGLRIMEHRCDVLGGAFAVGRSGANGTVVRCRVPAPSRPVT